MFRIRQTVPVFLLFLVFISSVEACSPEPETFEEEVIIYNTYGYMDGEEWVIPMRLYVVDDREFLEGLLTSLLERSINLTPRESDIFRSRISDFIKDSESREEVIFVFDNDPDNEEFRVEDQDGNYPRSTLNGIIEGHIRISKERADELLYAQNSESGWLDICVVSDGHLGSGRIRLIGPEGISVISDIDDTVKITGMPMGMNFFLQKTFFEEYAAAPGMTDLFNKWSGAPFHYVSGTPWQFYRPLTGFLFHEETGYPPGSFHMRFAPKNFGSIITWRTLSQLITDEKLTYNQKLGQIVTILENFPEREFILIGDSGERDPEIYREVAERYPDQVQKIYIRDVVNDRNLRPERLEGMTIIPAPTFRRTGD